MRTRQAGVRGAGAPVARPSASGFTLMEVLLGVALGGIALNLLVTTLITTFRLFDRGTYLAAVNDGSQTALNQVVKDLKSAVRATEGAPSFRGEPSALEFLQAAPAAADGGTTPYEGGVRRIALRFEPDKSGGGRLAKVFLAKPGNAAQPAEQTATLSRNVTQLTFRYFNGASWQSAWASPDLPRAVEIVLTFGRGAQGTAPTRVASTIAAIPTAP